MSGLVLSLFPGIGMLDMAFEEEGFCVVRGPDILWGGDIKKFNPPSGKFDGVIGGPPCQVHSSLASLVKDQKSVCLISEYERCVDEASPSWFVMENVKDAPLPCVEGYQVRDVMLRDHWCGGETMRLRRFSFGTENGLRLEPDTLALHKPDPWPAALASGSQWNSANGRPEGSRTTKVFRKHLQCQGLPPDFDLPGFTVAEKVRAVGNGVPLCMGRAVAKAVKKALADV